MTTFFATHNKAFKAEAQKLRHSGMLWLCVGAAAFIPIITTLVGFFMDWDTPVEARWNRVFENNLQAFTGFFFPLFVVIMVVRLVYLEHRSDTWKLIETQPVSKSALYMAKWEIAVLISLISLLGLLLFAWIGGNILQFGRPSLKLDQSSIDWGKILKIVSRYWVTGLGIISIQYFLSLLIKSFAVPMSIGLIAIIGGSIFAGFGVLNWWPYSAAIFTTQSISGGASGQYFMAHEKISLLWAALFLWLGYQLYRRKTFHKAFIKPLPNLALALIAIGVFVLIVWMVNKPTRLSAYPSTIIAGEIESKSSVSQVAVLRAPLMDTVMTIPVKDNRFHAMSNSSFPTGIYYLRTGNSRAEIFVGDKDSVYIDWKISDKNSDVKVSGTRLAENAYLQNYDSGNPSYLVENAYRQTPAEFASSVMSEWRDRVKSIDDFKTVDRIKPREDFIAMQKKLFSMRLLSIVDVEYPKIHAAYYPNEELKYPKSLDKLRKDASMNAPELASFASYRAYVRGAVRQKVGVNDSAYFNAIRDSVQDHYTRDMILYEAAQESIFKLRDSTQRNMAISRILEDVQNERVKARLLEANTRANNLQRGKIAYNFAAESLNGKQMTLSSLAGKYVVIDFWATWCVPCKKEAPYFEEYAERFTREDVAFVSLSVDEDKNAWAFDANYKRNKRVLQLLAKDTDGQMAKSFALNTIPRYILIDPKGRIINAQMPNASDPEFESTLLKEIPSLSRYQ
jgi:thiol-disulfide isomerase/thioredoxin